MNFYHTHVYVITRFLEIFVSTYGPGPLIIRKNFLSRMLVEQCAFQNLKKAYRTKKYVATVICTVHQKYSVETRQRPVKMAAAGIELHSSQKETGFPL